MVELSQRIAQSERLASEPTPDGRLVLHLTSGRYYELGRVGGFIWERLDGSADLGCIVADVVRRFSIGEEQARQDLCAFVNDLLEAGLARVVG